MNSRELFKEAASGDLRRVYLLYGEEEYAKDRAVEALAATIDEAVRDFNVDLLDAPNAGRIVETARTWPMMADRRIVIARGAPCIGGAESEAKAVTAFLPEIPDCVTLVFVHRGATDARKALYKAIAKQGAAVNFERYSENEAASWASSTAKKRGTDLPIAVAHELVARTGRFISDIASETAKLCDYVGTERAVTTADLDALVKPNLEYTVFEILEHFLAGRHREAFAQLYEAYREDERGAPMQLMAFFASRFRMMLQARVLLDGGKNDRQAAESLGGSPYAAKKAVEATRRFTRKQLEDALLALAEADANLKSSRESAADALTRALMRIFAG